MHRNSFITHGKLHIKQLEKERKNQIFSNNKPIKKSYLLINTNHLSSRQQVLGCFFLLLLTNAHCIDVSNKITFPATTKHKISKVTPTYEGTSHKGQDSVPVEDRALSSPSDRINNLFDITDNASIVIGNFTATSIIDTLINIPYSSDESAFSLSSGCPRLKELKAAFTKLSSPFHAKKDDLNEETPDFKILDPIKTIQRSAYYAVYLLEYNELYAHYPYFTLSDHYNHLIQLSKIYDTIIPLIKKNIDLNHITPCLEKKSNLCGYVNISKHMHEDLQFFQKYHYGRENTSDLINNATHSYITHLNKITDKNVLFGHFMVLLKLNMHGGYYSTLIGLVDIFKRSGITEIKKHTDKRKVERIVAGTDGAMGYMPYDLMTREEINQWLLEQIDNTPHSIQSILKGYRDSFRYLSYIYQKILEDAGDSYVYRLMHEIQRHEKIKLYSPEEVKQYRDDAIDDNIVVQIEYLANNKFLDILKSKGFNKVIAVDSEFTVTHSPLQDINVTPDKLPQGTLKLSVIQDKGEKRIAGSWFDGFHIKKYKSKLILPNSLSVDFERITKLFLSEITDCDPKQVGSNSQNKALILSQQVYSLSENSFFKYSSEATIATESPQFTP